MINDSIDIKSLRNQRMKNMLMDMQQAEAGNAFAQFRIGMFYYDQYTHEFINPEKDEADIQNAVLWLRKAAEQGHPEAQYRIGHCYMHGLGL